ncbi:MAG: excinuclease ABC subunit C [Acidobacteria bacterium]|nr:MAG: excinuclease ABC subunit C [Acidobacteriota bacterium]
MVYVYVLQSTRDSKLYTGCTHDLRQRLLLHNGGKVESTRNRVPLRLIYYEACLNERGAFRREKYLKTAYGKRFIKTRCRSYFMGQ